MNHSFKVVIRHFTNNSKVLSLVYKKISNMRVEVLKKQSDAVFLKRKFLENTGKPLDLDNPKSFNEKLQFLKLYDRNPLYTTMADKYEAKRYLCDKIEEKYIVPTYGVWDSFDDIEFDSLPEQFVLKCNHDCGSVFICENKKNIQIDKLSKEFSDALKRNYYYEDREWPYKDIKPKIFAEQYLGNNGGKGLIDYKLMCFNGKVKCAFTCTNRKTKLNVTFYDINWKRMPFERYYKSDPEEIPKPKNWDKMIEIAETIASDATFLRVDFYEIENKLYIGELTFFPGGGMEVFSPNEWDYILGDWLDIDAVTL